MAQKKITDLQLISSVTDSLNFASDNGIQSYRNTALQLKNYILPDAGVTRVKLAVGAVAPLLEQSKSSAYSILSTDDIVLADSSGGAFTLTMPTEASTEGRVFTITKTTNDFSVITINDSSASLITTINTLGESIKLYSDGSLYYVIDRYIPSQWIEYTPTIANFGTVSSVSFFWKRQGDSILVRGKFSSGTSVATEAQIGLPSGLAIDSTKTPTALPCGFVVRSTSTTNQWVLNATGADTYFNVAEINTSGGLSPANANSLTSSGQTLAISSDPVAITGWKG